MSAAADHGLVYAGFWIRVLASLVDTILTAIILLPLMRLIYGPAFFAVDAPLIMGPAHVLLGYVLPAVAIIAFWIYREATPGKMMVGARVVDARTGGHPTTGQFVIRYLGYFLSSFPLGLGLLWVAFDSRKQGWHDKLAHTVVVRPRPDGAARFDHDTMDTQAKQPERWQA
ncbi:hypothetical protein T5B8_12828 [Salinisphaera sp. T5B8]|uniref:RDD family protein n=1 Tax=Salinisphaera sp. T5B8 TaxID=1304154 RepID=UPI0033401162